MKIFNENWKFIAITFIQNYRNNWKRHERKIKITDYKRKSLHESLSGRSIWKDHRRDDIKPYQATWTG